MTEILGGSLYDVFIKPKQWPSNEALWVIIKDLLAGLKLLKTCNVIHCDLKPENILLKTDWIEDGIKIIDFGSAVYCENHISDYLQTWPYWAPEISLCNSFDFAVDMWSFGCILYELVTS